MIRRPPRSTRTDTLLPYTTLFRSDLMQALATPQAALCGYDWGGRAACIVAALWPERVRCLVTGDGYNVQDIPRSAQPLAPETEHRLWYQYYFHSARGVEGLTQNRRELCQLLWRLWRSEEHTS